MPVTVHIPARIIERLNDYIDALREQKSGPQKVSRHSTILFLLERGLLSVEAERIHKGE